MTKKNYALLLFAMGLTLVYVTWFTSCFRSVPLRISHTTRSLGRVAPRGSALPGLRFRVNPPVRFTELTVVPLAEYETNQHVVPVWHLVSKSGSQPVDEFSYGIDLPGMQPAIAGMAADVLQTNVTYRMFIKAGRSAGEHDFELK
jgi:hypothetical protein